MPYLYNLSSKMPVRIWVMMAGGLGALCRVLVGLLFEGEAFFFPWGTFFCNMLGSFLFIWLRLQQNHMKWSHVFWQRVVTTGFLGAFTTFSALGFETWMLLNLFGIWFASFYVGLSLAGGAMIAWLLLKARKSYA